VFCVCVSVSVPVANPVPPQFDDQDSLNDRLEALFNTFDNDCSGEPPAHHWQDSEIRLILP
jgi:hypothetical protein